MNQSGGMLKDDSITKLVAIARAKHLNQPQSASPTNDVEIEHKIYIFDRDLLGPEAEQVAISLTIEEDQVLNEPPLNRKPARWTSQPPPAPVQSADPITLSHSRRSDHSPHRTLTPQPRHPSSPDSIYRPSTRVASSGDRQPDPSYPQHQHPNQPLHRARSPQPPCLGQAVGRYGASARGDQLGPGDCGVELARCGACEGGKRSVGAIARWARERQSTGGVR